MLPMGMTPADTARIIDYHRFYKPTIQDFKKGFEYDYVAVSFRNILTHLPDIDETGRKPTCTHDVWHRGIWGTPHGIIRKKHIKKMLKQDKIRARKYLPTSELKTLLKTQPLAFRYNNLHVVIFPKKMEKLEPLIINGEDIRKDKDILGRHHIYVNGVNEEILRSKSDSKLYKKWFDRPDEIKMDLRYLLGLDWPEKPGPNVLYKYFDGVFTKEETVFEKITANFKTGGPNNPPRLKSNGMPRGWYAMHKEALKETKYAGVEPVMHLGDNRKPIEELSDKAAFSRILRERRIKKKVKEEIEAHKSVLKEWSIKAQERNEEKMREQETVFVQDPEEMIHKMSRYRAERLENTGKGWKIVPKHMWKMQLTNERAERKAITDKNRVEPSGVNRRMKRTNFSKKQKTRYSRYQHIPTQYEKKKDGTYDTESFIVLHPDAEYEFIPVTRKIWDVQVNKMTGKRIANLVGEEPWMIPAYDEDGNKITKQAVKRVLKKVNPQRMEIKNKRKVKHRRRTILQHNFPPEIGKRRSIVKAAMAEIKEKKNVESKKQVETSEHTSSGSNKRTQQKSKSVEKVRGEDKRVKTPNIKH